MVCHGQNVIDQCCLVIGALEKRVAYVCCAEWIPESKRGVSVGEVSERLSMDMRSGLDSIERAAVAERVLKLPENWRESGSLSALPKTGDARLGCAGDPDECALRCCSSCHCLSKIN